MVSWQLNRPDEYDKYKLFSSVGGICEDMSELIAGSRTPLSAPDLMRRRLEVLTASVQVRESWWNETFEVAEIAYHPNGCIKVNPCIIVLRGLAPGRVYNRERTLIMEYDAFEQFEGYKIPRIDELVSFDSCFDFVNWTIEKVLNSAFWDALADGDRALLKDYAGAVFARVQNLYGGNKAMNVSVTDPPNVPCARAISITGNFSCAEGDNKLGNSAHLIGVEHYKRPQCNKLEVEP